MLIIYGANVILFILLLQIFCVNICNRIDLFLYTRSVVIDASLDPDYNLTEIKSDIRLPKWHTSTMTYILTKIN